VVYGRAYSGAGRGSASTVGNAPEDHCATVMISTVGASGACNAVTLAVQQLMQVQLW
jgi:hypothetical protein